MSEIRSYDGADEIPRELERQIPSLLHAEWPAPDDETDSPLVAPQWYPTYYLLAEGGTVPGLEAFYGRCGWEAMPGLQVRTDEYDEQHHGDSLPMMLFLSASARRVRAGFHVSPLVLPGDEW